MNARFVALTVLVALPLATALAGPPESRLRDLKVRVEPGTPARVEVKGAADLPDNTILSVSLKNERLDIQGRHWTLLEMRRVMVKGGAFEEAFPPRTLPPGACRVEVDCDRQAQYPNVRIPASGELHAESSFKVDFTEDAASPTAGLAEACAEMASLNGDLEQADRDNAGKTGDPARLEAFAKFKDDWIRRLTKLTGGLGTETEDLIYPQTRTAIQGAAKKAQLFLELYETRLKGEKSETFEGHPNWYEPDVATDLAGARRTLAKEFVFNVRRKVVDWGYDKATDLHKELQAGKPAATRQWGLFRDQLGKDIEKCRTAWEALASGPAKAEIASIASDVPTLLAAGQQMLEAVDQDIAQPGSGKPALDRAAEALRKAYLTVEAKLQAPAE